MLKMSSSKNAKAIEKKMLNIETRFKKGIVNGARLAANNVVKTARDHLDTGTRTGRKYSNLPNRSSAPGENPRTQSGRLSKSIYYNAGNTYSFSVGSNAPHARFLEFGTKHMRARPHPTLPWLKLAIEVEERNTENFLYQGVLKEIKC